MCGWFLLTIPLTVPLFESPDIVGCGWCLSWVHAGSSLRYSACFPLTPHISLYGTSSHYSNPRPRGLCCNTYGACARSYIRGPPGRPCHCHAQDEWRQRLVSAYGSSSRVLGAGGGDGGSAGGSSNSNFEFNSHTRKRRTRSASTTTPTPPVTAGGSSSSSGASNNPSNNLSTSHQDNGTGGGGGGGGIEDESGEPECAAAVEELCSALGVPRVQDVAASGPAMAMVRAWGRQFAGAFGPAQPGAGVCGIGSEVRNMKLGYCSVYLFFFVASALSAGWDILPYCTSYLGCSFVLRMFHSWLYRILVWFGASGIG